MAKIGLYLLNKTYFFIINPKIIANKLTIILLEKINPNVNHYDN